MGKSFLDTPGLPRGLRNNNPGNIRGGGNWQGMIGTDGLGFSRFQDVEHGLRALAIDLTSKIKGGFDSIELILYRYAPASENDTEAYIGRIGSVARSTGFGRSEKLQPTSDTLGKLIRGIINVELGSPFSSYITSEDINKGISMTGMSITPVEVVGISTAGILFALALYLLATMPKIPKAKKLI